MGAFWRPVRRNEASRFGILGRYRSPLSVNDWAAFRPCQSVEFADLPGANQQWLEYIHGGEDQKTATASRATSTPQVLKADRMLQGLLSSALLTYLPRSTNQPSSFSIPVKFSLQVCIVE